MKYSPPLSPGLDKVSGEARKSEASHLAEVAVGLVFAVRSGGDGPFAAIVAGGIPVIRRQIRQLHERGAGRIVLAASGNQTHVIEQARREAQRDGMAIEVAESPATLIAALAGDPAMVIDEGLLVDERMLAAFFGQDAATGANPVIAMRDAKLRTPAGLARLPALSVSQELAARLLVSGLSGIGLDKAVMQDLSGLDAYAPDRRRHLSIVWLPLRSAADGARGTSLLLDSAQKGCLDWPARFIHTPIENLLTRLLLPLPITPNLISVFVFIMGLYAAWSFATGNWALALVLALAIGPLDGVDGKLARTRHEFSRWGDLEHVADKIVEYLCYVGMAAWIGTAWAWAVCSLIVLFAFAEAIQGEFYRRLTGGQLDDAGGIERRFRLVSGRRNTFMWSLIPFVAFGAWHAGFVMIAIYSVATFFFMQWRFFVRLGEVARKTSPVIAENMRRTAYAFLKKA